MRSDVKYSTRYSTQFLRKNRIGTSALHAIPFMQVNVRETVDVEVDQTRAVSLRSKYCRGAPYSFSEISIDVAADASRKLLQFIFIKLDC